MDEVAIPSGERFDELREAIECAEISADTPDLGYPVRRLCAAAEKALVQFSLAEEGEKLAFGEMGRAVADKIEVEASCADLRARLERAEAELVQAKDRTRLQVRACEISFEQRERLEDRLEGLTAERDEWQRRAEALEAALRELQEAEQALESAERRHRQIGSPESLERCTEARERMNAAWRFRVLAEREPAGERG